MASSYDDNSDARFIDLEDDDAGEEHVSTKKARMNPPPSTTKRRGKPPKTPTHSTVTQLVKVRKNRSPYWDHFEKIGNGETASCIYCHDIINCKSNNGTSTMSGHLKKCPSVPANVDIKQKLLNFETTTIVNEDGSIENVSVPTLWAYDYDRARKSLAKMIIVDELPFLTVEKNGFKGFCKDMNPLFTIPSRFTVAKDCYNLFIEERRKLHDFFGTMSSRVCLTTDLWT
ncbi:zinc finger BED domain-containing protein RICESLEEPER 3-like [Silene latifolia]|uniref:zinc finger BED domain-containing protein RICESLEEPER 3-like n=1 Tax=Silene latifolia TaxID=37657 RepID=UPI003D770A20